MKHALLFIVIGIAFWACDQEQKTKEIPERPDQLTEENMEDSLQYSLVKARLDEMLNYPVTPTAFPRSMEPNGEVRGVPSKDWTSGFYPGSLLFLSELTGDDRYLLKAEEWLPHLEDQQFNDRTHDMGFKVFCSIGNAHRLTDNPKYAELVVAAARTLTTRFDPEVGCIKSWDFGKDRWTFPVIIDNMMNLELLFEATRLSGDSTFHRVADSHAAVTLKNHFRADNSSFHVVDYDPETGSVIKKITHQGINAESSWARGQAWGLYGFTMAYRYTSNKAYLDQAEAIAEFILSHPRLPEDKIPFWDFDDPKIPNTPRDASAAAIIASALAELSTCSTENAIRYKEEAAFIINTLSSEQYVLNEGQAVPFILKHSTGNMPKNDEVDLPISYADYYYLEALVRQGVQF